VRIEVAVSGVSKTAYAGIFLYSLVMEAKIFAAVTSSLNHFACLSRHARVRGFRRFPDSCCEIRIAPYGCEEMIAAEACTCG
jgi:hypothetical protein